MGKIGEYFENIYGYIYMGLAKRSSIRIKFSIVIKEFLFKIPLINACEIYNEDLEARRNE